MSVTPTPILCIGSVLWDIIGKSKVPMVEGSDQPGFIKKIPGGVALNIAMALRKHALDVELLSSMGKDPDGDALLNTVQEMGLGTKYLHRSTDLPTDFYMAIESPNGVLGAIADAHSLEKAGDAILAPLKDGRLGTALDPFEGAIVLDGNLTLALLTDISLGDEFSKAEIFVAPASPGKADRLKPFLGKENCSIFVNKREADILGETSFSSSRDAAEVLFETGLKMAVVTDGEKAATVVTKSGTVSEIPKTVEVKRFTGAGDTFMAAFLFAHLKGNAPSECLSFSLEETNAFISSE